MPHNFLTQSEAAPKTNAHIHLPPNFSAFQSVGQAVDLAASEGLRVLGASNYYDFQVYAPLAEQAKARGIHPLFGLEVMAMLDDLRQTDVKINDPGNPGKFYLCGKGITHYDPLPADAAALMAVIRENDAARMTEMASRLSHLVAEAGLDGGPDASALRSAIAQRYGCPLETVYLQERHLAQAYQELFFERLPEPEREPFLTSLFGVPSSRSGDPVTVQNEIRSHLMKAGKPAFVQETYVGFDHVYRLVLALGGIPCYPTLADGTSPICPFETPVEQLVASIRERGIHAAELIPIRNRPEVLTEYVTAMRRAGLVVTAGTEHNTPDLLPLEPTCLGGLPVPEPLRAIFWEGACVVAAHQERVRTGESGFVDENGRPNQEFPTDEDRIAAFARWGAVVIERTAKGVQMTP